MIIDEYEFEMNLNEHESPSNWKPFGEWTFPLMNYMTRRHAHLYVTPRPHGWRFSWFWLPNEVCMGKINQPLAIGTAYGWHLVGTNFDDDDNEDPPGDEEAY